MLFINHNIPKLARLSPLQSLPLRNFCRDFSNSTPPPSSTVPFTTAPDLHVSICSSSSDANAWIQREVLDKGLDVVGFDTEWNSPFRFSRSYGSISGTLQGKKPKRVEARTGLVQIATPTAALLLRMKQIDEIPSELRMILGSSAIIKTGVGVRDDLLKLQKDYDIAYKGYCDLSHVAYRFFGDTSSQTPGLYPLANQLFGVNLKKVKKIAASNWERHTLTIKQVRYAVLDAYLSLKIYERFKEMGAFNTLHGLAVDKAPFTSQRKLRKSIYGYLESR